MASNENTITRWFLRHHKQQPPEQLKSTPEASDADNEPAHKTQNPPIAAKRLPPAAAPAPVVSATEPLQPSLFIPLAPVQSCQIHGWLNPKRTLDWNDICSNPAITVRGCRRSGIAGDTLKSLQPDVHMWICHKGVGLADVPWMLEWPLHPVYDLHANLGDLATAHLAANVMAKLGITYDFLRSIMNMTDDWMRVLHYSPQEWALMGFTDHDVREMGVQRVQWVFAGEEFDAVLIRVSSAMPVNIPAAAVVQ